NRRSEAHFNWHYHAALTRLNESFSLMGVPLVEMAEHLEPTPLARSEWIKFFALFFNQEAEAESAFGEMEVRYNALRARVAAVAERPRVLVGAPEDDGWRMYGGRNVHTRMIEDAGGRYLWEDDVETDSGRYTHFEDALARAREAELWIVGPNTSFGSRIFETTVLDPRYDYIPAVRNGRVWVANINWPTGPNPWWDYSLISPHFELADHVRMIHPGLLPPGDMTFYRSLAGLQVTDASSR
uniref:ABC transporter substrate-binding protein n=1 Tax=Candidatus Palauibacter scopulicola TaxID=3056741 RepID=UPI0023A05454